MNIRFLTGQRYSSYWFKLSEIYGNLQLTCSFMRKCTNLMLPTVDIYVCLNFIIKVLSLIQLQLRCRR